MTAHDPGAPGAGVLAGVVLAGGASRRMGQDKAALPGPGGRALLAIAVDALRAAGCAPLLVVSDRAGRRDAAALGAREVVDRRPGEGPLAGLEAGLTALAATPGGGGWCLLLPCDVPRPDPLRLAALAATTRALAPGDALALVPRAGSPDGPRAQPLVAAYHVGCLPAVTALLDGGTRRLRDLLDRVRVRWLDWPEGAWCRDWDTPGDVG